MIFRVEVKANNRFRLYMGVDNAFHRPPPFDLLGTESGSISPVGFSFYAGAVANF